MFWLFRARVSLPRLEMKSRLLILRRREQGRCPRAPKGPTSQEGQSSLGEGQSACVKDPHPTTESQRGQAICTGQEGVWTRATWLLTVGDAHQHDDQLPAFGGQAADWLRI